MDTEIGAIVIIWPDGPGVVIVDGSLVPASHLVGEIGIVVDRRPLAYCDVCIALIVGGSMERHWMRASDVDVVTPSPFVMVFSDVVWPE